MTESVWVLADPRAGTAAQALGIAERLDVPFRTVPLAWGRAARVPWPFPTLIGLPPGTRAALRPPWPSLVIAAGRRAGPVALWLGRRGARTVHAMRPGFGARRFDLLVVGQHDDPSPAPNLLPILGATHRLSPARLAAARLDWQCLRDLPSPRIAVLLGGPVGRDDGFPPGFAGAVARWAAGAGGSVLATTSRRTGHAAADAAAAALAGMPHRLHRWGDGGANPYAGFLAWADAVIVTGDSVSMLSEALATTAPVYLADPGRLGPRHRAVHRLLTEAGLLRTADLSRQPDHTRQPIAAGAPSGTVGLAPARRAALDETARVAALIRARGWAAPLVAGDERGSDGGCIT